MKHIGKKAYDQDINCRKISNFCKGRVLIAVDTKAENFNFAIVHLNISLEENRFLDGNRLIKNMLQY